MSGTSNKNIKKTTQEFINEAKLIHNNKYDYSLVNYINTDTKIKIICPIHGEFEQTPYKHIKGQGCKNCGYNKNSNLFRNTIDDFIKKSIKIHGNKYDYSLVNYKTNKDRVKIICPIHGEFEQTPNAHIKYGCKLCGYLKNTKLTEEFINESKEINKNKYDYSLSEYINSYTNIKLICPIHGEFEQTPKNHLSQKQGCLKCSLKNVKAENDISDFIKSFNINVELKNRNILDKQELDIYIPSHNLAIEFNGLYWHSEKFKLKNYHLNKTIACEKQGIRLIHIFEDEWVYKQDIVRSRLKNILGLTSNKIHARKCIIKEIDNKKTKEFLELNHIQGHVNAKIKIGLYYNDELIGIMTFGSLRKTMGKNKSNNSYELLRFCNKLDTTVIGGANKLLQYFIRNYNPNEIISYADRRWSNGNLYEKLGFEFSHNSRPNYYYIDNDKRKYRFNFRKNVLIEQGYNSDKSEHEIMINRKIYRIYDSGNKCYKLLINPKS